MCLKCLNSKRKPKSNNGIDVQCAYYNMQPSQTKRNHMYIVHAPNRLRYTNQIVLQIITGSLHITKWQWRHSRTHAITSFGWLLNLNIADGPTDKCNEIECEGGQKSALDCSYMWKWWEVSSTTENEKIIINANGAKETKLIQIDCFCCCCSFLVYILFNAHTISDSSIVTMELMEWTGCSKLCPVKEIVGEIGGFFFQWNFSLSIHSFICFDHIAWLLFAVSAIIIVDCMLWKC